MNSQTLFNWVWIVAGILFIIALVIYIIGFRRVP